MAAGRNPAMRHDEIFASEVFRKLKRAGQAVRRTRRYDFRSAGFRATCRSTIGRNIGLDRSDATSSIRGPCPSPRGAENSTGPGKLSGSGGFTDFWFERWVMITNVADGTWLPPEPCFKTGLARLCDDLLLFSHRRHFEQAWFGVAGRLFVFDRAGHLVCPRRSRATPASLLFYFGHGARQCSFGALRKRARSPDLTRVSMVLPSR